MWLQPLSQWLLAVTITSQFGAGPALTPGSSNGSAPTSLNSYAPANPSFPPGASPSPTESAYGTPAHGNSLAPADTVRQPAQNPSPAGNWPSSPPTNSYSPANRSQVPPSDPRPSVITAPLPEITPMRQATFTIPFRLDRVPDATWQPVEAQLFVSVDRGATWRLYSKASAAEKQFKFRAGGDGEFWFAVKTANQSGQVRPENIAGPGLRILVDTKAPSLKIAARAAEAGQVVVHWEADEPYLKPNSLKVVYRVSAVAPWQSVVVDPQSQQVLGTHASGDVAFQPKSGSGEVQIRAEIADTAGNVGTANGLVKLNQFANASGVAEGNGSVPSPVNPPIGRRYAPPVVGNPPNPFGLPPGERPRMVNAKAFELEYDVDSVGPSGIGRVELWSTRDGGKSWRRLTTDTDNRSPLPVQVEEEGMYGFRVAVTNGAGLGGKPPMSGDLPDLWLGVDLTKPTGRIISAQHGSDAETGQLIVSWQADDQLLAPRPVSLAFSENATGPWTPIASGLENTGRYAWPMDGRLPAQIFLRLEVRDEAGNVTEHQTPQPVAVDQSRPTARVRGIRPVGQNGLR